jgi:hypothetical protein
MDNTSEAKSDKAVSRRDSADTSASDDTEAGRATESEAPDIPQSARSRAPTDKFSKASGLPAPKDRFQEERAAGLRRRRLPREKGAATAAATAAAGEVGEMRSKTQAKKGGRATSGATIAGRALTDPVGRGVTCPESR